MKSVWNIAGTCCCTRLCGKPSTTLVSSSTCLLGTVTYPSVQILRKQKFASSTKSVFLILYHVPTWLKLFQLNYLTRATPLELLHYYCFTRTNTIELLHFNCFYLKNLLNLLNQTKLSTAQYLFIKKCLSMERPKLENIFVGDSLCSNFIHINKISMVCIYYNSQLILW